MSTTKTHPPVVCPALWCDSAPHGAHDDMGKPGDAWLASRGGSRGGPEYDPAIEGSWCHRSSGYTVASVEVSVSRSTDLAGNDNEPRTVFVSGHDLSVEQAQELARALLAACEMLAVSA